MKRDELYDRTPAGDDAFRRRVIADIGEARRRGWTSLEVCQIPEPPVPMGSPPGSNEAVRVPDYGDGEDGGYERTFTPNDGGELVFEPGATYTGNFTMVDLRRGRIAPTDSAPETQ